MPAAPHRGWRGCSVTEYLPQDLDEYFEQIHQSVDWLRTKGYIANTFTDEDADNLVRLSRAYVGVSPEFAAAVLESGISWDNPALQDLVLRDAEEQENSVWSMVQAFPKGVLSGLALGAGAMWEEGIARPARTATRIFQGEDPLTAYMRAGPSDLVAAIGEASQGRPVNLGPLNPFNSDTGYFPKSTLAHETPEFAEQFTARYGELASNPDLHPNEARKIAFDEISESTYGDIGRPITYEQQAFREATILTKTRGGKQYTTPFSFGRVAALQFFNPDTPMFNTMSAALDLTSQVRFDPLNMPADELQLAWRSRNLITPARNVVEEYHHIADAYRAALGDEGIELATAPIDPGRPSVIGQHLRDEGRILIDDDLARHTQSRMDMFDSDAPPSVAYGLWDMPDGTTRPNPYGQAMEDMGVDLEGYKKAKDRYGQGDLFDHDLTIEHELAHRELQAEFSDRYQALSREHDELVGRMDARQEALGISNEPGLDDVYEELANRRFAVSMEMENVLWGMEHDATVKAWTRMIDHLDNPSGITGRRLRIAALEEAGLGSRGPRPWIHRQTAEQFYRQTSRGRRTLRMLADNTSEAANLEVLGELPRPVQYAVLQATTEDEVLQALKPVLGTMVPEAPVVGALRNNPGIAKIEGAGFISRMRRESTLSRWGRRFIAETNDPALNPYDITASMVKVRNYLHTIGSDPDDIDRILRKMYEMADGDYSAMRIVAADVIDATARKLADEGYDAVDVRYLMESFLKEQYDNHEYLVNIAAEPIYVDGLDTYRYVTPSGETLDAVIREAHHDAQFAQQTIAIPNQRDVRRLTSQARTFTNKARIHFGLDPIAEANYATKILDGIMAGWRTMVLFRPAWALRVIPEELARQVASGYAQVIRNPDDYFMLAVSSDVTGIQGDSLRDYFRAQDLGSQGWQRNLANQPMTGTRFNAARAHWNVVPTYQVGSDGTRTITNGGKIGLQTAYLQMWNSRLHRAVAIDGVDGAMQFFRTTEEGRAIIDDLAPKAQSQAWDIYNDNHLRRKLQSIEAEQALMAGGDVIYRRRDGTWVDSAGRAYDDYSTWTAKSLQARLRELDVPGRSKARTQAEMAALLRTHTGRVELAKLRNRQFVVVKEGKESLRNLIIDGVDEDGTARIFEDMNRRQLMELEDWLPTQFNDEYIAPAHVRVPNPTLESRTSRMNKRFTDTMFKVLMPTDAIVRSPFAQIRYTEEVARFYVFADEATRARLDEWINLDGNKHLKSIFDEFKQKTLDLHGYKEVPAIPAAQQFTFEEIDTWAKHTALEATKEKFYELARSRNFIDAGRLIAVFGDAWWEVLTRWAKMLDPTGLIGDQPGQAIRNLRRITQIHESGFFSENEFGDEVFNWPGFGLLGVGKVMRGEASVTQAMFIDPSIRSLAAPGASPLVQVAASAVRPLIPDGRFKEFLDSVTYGEFSPPDQPGEAIYKTFLPTWMRRVVEYVKPMGQFDQVYGDEILQLYSAFLLESGQPQDAESVRRLKDQAQRTGTQHALGRIVDGLINPVSPRYIVGFFQEAAASGQPEMYFDIAFIGRELRAAEELFDGDKIAARRYMVDRFGLDPLKTTSKTSTITDRPDSREGFLFLQQNPELRKHFDTALMAFVPEGPEEDFYRPAWQAALREGAVEYKDLDVGAQIISRNGGAQAYDALVIKRDLALKAAESELGKDTQTFRNYRDVTLKRWFENEVSKIQLDYFAWGSDKVVYGNTQRPTYRTLFDELYDVSRLGTERRRVASEINPEMVDFLDFTMELWDYLEELSVSKRNSPRWWRIADPTEPLASREQYELRNWFAEGVKEKINTMSEDGQRTASWVMEFVITPLISGWDFDDVAFLSPEDPPPVPALQVGENVLRWRNIEEVIPPDELLLEQELESIGG